MLAIFVLILIFLLAFLPYISRIAKRTFFWVKLKKICRIKKYKIKVTDLFAFFIKNCSCRYNITVDTGKKVFCIKQWNEFYKGSNIIFNASGAVIKRKKYPEIFSNGDKATQRVHEKLLGSLKIIEPGTQNARKEIPLFIFSTNDAALYFYDGASLKRLFYGDKLYDMTIISAKSFLSELEK